MRNDLIKRMDTIENIWSLFNNTYNDSTRFDAEETELAKRVLSDVQTVIDEQPTAYDVDKVVEQIKGIEICGKCLNNRNTTAVCADFCDIGKKIEIIKSGGIAKR